MNHLTTLYVNQADRERQIAEDLRNRQILHTADRNAAEPTRLVTSASQPATTNPHPASLQARAAGR
jgi:hypothetical protein